MAEEEKPATEPKKGKATLFIIIGAIVAVLLLGGIIAWLVFGGGDEDGHDSHAADIPAPTGQSLTPEQQALLQNEAYRNPVAIQPLEKTILVNLKPLDQSSPRGGFAKFNVTFILSDKNTSKEIGAKQEIISQIVLDETSKFTAADIMPAQGRQKLQSDIKNSVNSILVDGRVEAVVLPDFMIQP